MTHLLPSPADIGLPEKFDRWRMHQDRAILDGLDAAQRFTAQCAPVGSGKSICYVAQALLADKRAAILTSTKGLQAQIISDFRDCGMSDVMGMNAYQCVALARGVFGEAVQGASCEDGPCHYGANCKVRGECFYYNAVFAAQMARLVVTNYAFWMNAHKYGEGLGKFDLLVLDEAHDAPATLASFVSVELDGGDIQSLLSGRVPDIESDGDAWRTWAAYYMIRAQDRRDRLASLIKDRADAGDSVPYEMLREVRKLKRLASKLEEISLMQGEWVIEKGDRRIIQFSPVWAAPYAERYLFLGIPKVLLFSATVTHKSMDDLGIPAASRAFFEYPSVFPVRRRPVYHVPTVKMRHGVGEDKLRYWVSQMDNIIRGRLDRKGIIHTVSYSRTAYVLRNSEYAEIMMQHSSHNTRSVVQRFRDAEAPCVLVSPSLSTGWDFIYDQCRYQIIGKLPFPDSRSKIVQARQELDKDYGPAICAQQIEQTTGRATRAVDDWSETFIIDDNIGWFLYKYKHFFHRWWLESFKKVLVIPAPLEAAA